MAWLFGSGRRTPPGQSDFRARDRQIGNLHEMVPGLQLKSKDNSLYEVQITGPDGARVMLRVFLPTKFPAERPGDYFYVLVVYSSTSLYTYRGKRNLPYDKMHEVSLVSSIDFLHSH